MKNIQTLCRFPQIYRKILHKYAILIGLTIFILSTGKLAFAEIIYAQSLSRIDIQAAVDSASPGDTVILPSGTNSSYTGTVTIRTTNIHIKGAGKTNTIIELGNDNDGRYNPIFDVESDGVKFSDMKLVAWKSYRGWSGCLRFNFASYFEVYNCEFRDTDYYSVYATDHPIVGVIHNCDFYDGVRDGGGLGYGVHVSGEQLGELTGNYGEASWSDPLDLGSMDGVYIEDCYFENFRHYIVANHGGRYISRYNAVTANCSQEGKVFDTHGPDYEGRGTRKVELYGNTVTRTPDSGNEWFAIFAAGSGVIFNNTVTGLGEPQKFCYFLHPCCDVNNCGSYPEVDQCTDFYLWGNTANGVSYNAVIEKISCNDETGYPYFARNRDWFDYPKPGYTPLAYPHPLRQQSSPSIGLSTTALEFAAEVGGTNPPDQTFQISNVGGGILDWSISQDSGWLMCSPQSGQGNAEIIASVDSSGLLVGTYAAIITITSPIADNSPQNISVTLNVTAADHDVTTPATPNSPSNGVPNVTYTFSTGGASCSLGHNIVYRFDWGDGTYSSWSSSTSTSHAWSSTGTYSIRARARCAVNIDILSGWSSGKTIQISNGSTVNLNMDIETVSAYPDDGGTTSPSEGTHSYPIGNSVPLTATPNTDYRFSKWTGDVSNIDPYEEMTTVVMDGEKSLTALFFTKCGDVNGDLNITPSDSQLAFDIYLGRADNPTEAQRENADVNCDGTQTAPKVTPGDANAIFVKYLGKEELPGDCSCKSRAEVSSFPSKQSINFSNIDLKVEDVEVQAGMRISIPILINSPNDLNSFGLDIIYPAYLLDYAGLVRTELTEDFIQLDGYEVSNGVIRIGGYIEDPVQIPSNGTLVMLVFQVRENVSGNSLFILTNAVDDLEGASLTPGRILISSSNIDILPEKNRIERTKGSINK